MAKKTVDEKELEEISTEASAESAETSDETTTEVIETTSEEKTPKVYFVHTRDSIHEATILKEYPDGAVDLQVHDTIRTQNFVSGASSAIVNQLPGFFGRVRKGSGRADVGSYFIE